MEMRITCQCLFRSQIPTAGGILNYFSRAVGTHSDGMSGCPDAQSVACRLRLRLSAGRDTRTRDARHLVEYLRLPSHSFRGNESRAADSGCGRPGRCGRASRQLFATISTRSARAIGRRKPSPSPRVFPRHRAARYRPAGARRLRRGRAVARPAGLALGGDHRHQRLLQQEGAERCRQAGIDRYLLKPVQIAELQTALGGVLSAVDVSTTPYGACWPSIRGSCPSRAGRGRRRAGGEERG